MTSSGRGRAPALTPPTPLSHGHDLTQFACRHPDLDAWLREHALKSEGRSARTYVVCVGRRVVGYYAVAAGAVMRSFFPRKLRHGLPDPVPVLVLGRLAVDGEFERQGIGPHLLKEAMQRILALSVAVGLRAIFVHAVDDEAVAFYLRYGFVQFPAGERTLFLPVETIAASLER